MILSKAAFLRLVTVNSEIMDVNSPILYQYVENIVLFNCVIFLSTPWVEKNYDIKMHLNLINYRLS